MSLNQESMEPPDMVDEPDFDAIELPKINTKGLSPARALLAKLVAMRNEASEKADRLFAGRRDLADFIGKLEKEEAKANADSQNSINNVVDRIRSGSKWTIAPTKSPVSHSDELRTAWAALKVLDTDRAGLEALMISIEGRISNVTGHALFEYAESALRDEYKERVEALHETLVKIASLASVRGTPVPEVFALPRFGDYMPPTRIWMNAVDVAKEVWIGIVKAWETNPRLEPKITFEKYDPYKRDPPKVTPQPNVETGINPASIKCHEQPED